MKITLIPSSVDGGKDTSLHFLTSYRINDTVALDAGCLGLWGTPQEQASIKHVLLSHSHIDHIASLPIFLDNVYRLQAEPVVIHGSEAVLDSLKRDFFNGRVWPEFAQLDALQPPLLKLALLESGRSFALEGLRITPLAVDHAVPTHGFLVEDATSAVIFSSDTGPTEAIWQLANVALNLEAVFLEASFPSSMEALALLAGHLTPALFAREAQKLTKPVRMIAVHLKPKYHEQVAAELRALGMPNLEIGDFGVPYEFGTSSQTGVDTIQPSRLP